MTVKDRNISNHSSLQDCTLIIDSSLYLVICTDTDFVCCLLLEPLTVNELNYKLLSVMALLELGSLLRHKLISSVFSLHSAYFPHLFVIL